MFRTLVNFSPVAELQQMADMMDRVLNSFEDQGGLPAKGAPNSGFHLPVDIFERDNKLFVRAAIPGVSPEDVDIQIDQNVLMIRGETKQESAGEDTRYWRREYRYGSFSRAIALPETVNVQAAEADFDNGFVTISIPMREEAQPKSLRVPIKKGQGQTKKSIEQGRTNGEAKNEQEMAGSR